MGVVVDVVGVGVVVGATVVVVVGLAVVVVVGLAVVVVLGLAVVVVVLGGVVVEVALVVVVGGAVVVVDVVVNMVRGDNLHTSSSPFKAALAFFGSAWAVMYTRTKPVVACRVYFSG